MKVRWSEKLDPRSFPQVFQGVCVGGPEDGKSVTARDRSYRVIEYLDDNDLGVTRAKDTVDIREHFYEFDTVHWTDRQGERWLLGIWWYSEIDKDNRFPVLLQRYVDMANLLAGKGVYGRIVERLIGIVESGDRYSIFSDLYSLIDEIRDIEDRETVRK